MTLSGVIDLKSFAAARVKQRPNVRYDGSRGGYVVALLGKIAAFLADLSSQSRSRGWLMLARRTVPLHINDDQRGGVRVEVTIVRPCVWIWIYLGV